MKRISQSLTAVQLAFFAAALSEHKSRLEVERILTRIAAREALAEASTNLSAHITIRTPPSTQNHETSIQLFIQHY